MVFHHEHNTLDMILKSLDKAGVNPFMVEKVMDYLSDSEFKIYCQEFNK